MLSNRTTINIVILIVFLFLLLGFILYQIHTFDFLNVDRVSVVYQCENEDIYYNLEDYSYSYEIIDHIKDASPVSEQSYSFVYKNDKPYNVDPLKIQLYYKTGGKENYQLFITENNTYIIKPNKKLYVVKPKGHMFFKENVLFDFVNQNYCTTNKQSF